MQIIQVGCNGHLWAVRRWTVTPFSTLTEGFPVAEGQATWTSLPRSASPAARRSANLAAPLTSGEYVSAGMRIRRDRKSTRLNSSHVAISYAVFCLKKKKKQKKTR